MTEAERLVEEGLKFEEAGDLAGAERVYRAAAELSPEWSVPCFNLGLLCKHQSRWVESFEYNLRATVLDPDFEGSWWNLGIAATALSDWPTARRAWAACRLTPPEGNGPPDFGWGPNPVRLDPHGNAEVVWARRIDPARALVLSVPLPWSPYNFGTVVLTDGSIEGKRVVNGKEYPVFNMLAMLSPSRLRKYVIELATSDREAIDALSDLAERAGGAAEHWGMSTNIMCAQCSLGTPHQHPDRERTPAHPHCGLAAADDAQAEEIIRRWLREQPRADMVRWYDAGAAVD